MYKRQELAFRGHKENEQSLNKGNYLETSNLLAMEESFMKKQALYLKAHLLKFSMI